MKIPTFKDIESAHERIRPYIHRTPVLTCSTINGMTGAELYFKCENFQKGGAFKARGATNAVFSLTGEKAKRGVATHSSGNHAAALSLTAKKRGIKAYVAMPRTAPEMKKRIVAGYGAEIRFCEPTVESREETCRNIIEETGATLIPSYNDFYIISGHGTVARELLDQAGDLDVMLTCVGGGGLLSGISIWAKHAKPGIRIIGGCPENADNSYRSFVTGKLQPPVPPNTIADGLLMPLGDLTFKIIRQYADEIVTVTEEEIIKAMQLIWERMKIIIEPSSAVAMAAVTKKRKELKNKKIGVILSGGNVDLKRLPF